MTARSTPVDARRRVGILINNVHVESSNARFMPLSSV
jgi:hypothetical protein